jgi:uncharacterized protein (DUF952 family)
MTAPADNTIIYKICPKKLWQESESAGVFRGAPIDLMDGYIHLSTAAQVAETAARHFAGQDDLLLIHIDAALLGERLVWETSRGGALFPHLYCALDFSAVTKAEPLPLGPAGRHVFPDLV